MCEHARGAQRGLPEWKGKLPEERPWRAGQLPHILAPLGSVFQSWGSAAPGLELEALLCGSEWRVSDDQ